MLEFLIGGMSLPTSITGEFTKVVTRRGNVLELTYQDSAGVEQEMRFIGSERQPIVGLRRLAYIPDGETPAESHFLDTSKSASSMTERVPLAGISGVDDHHLAVWHADTLPELDLLATSSTVVNYRAAVGEPTALTVDGVDGFYYVSGSLNSLSSPGSTHDAFYLESRAGKILSPIYLAWEYAFASVTAATFTDPDRSKRIYSDGVVQWPVPVHPVPYLYSAPTQGVPTEADFKDDTRGEKSRHSNNTFNWYSTNSSPYVTGDQYLYIAMPTIYGAVSAQSRSHPNAPYNRIRTEIWDFTASVGTVTIDGVECDVYERDGPLDDFTITLTVGRPQPSLVQVGLVAYPSDRPDIAAAKYSDGTQAAITYLKQPGTFVIDGVTCQWYANSLYQTLSTGTRIQLTLGVEAP